ncbi:hypothetical protein A6R74_12285 [Halomonas sp. ALS9]|nr:hypothetical protein A6R74_12285 [Halomonas sp. ALS9]
MPREIRYHALRYVQEIDFVGFVARGKPQAHPREQREAVLGLIRWALLVGCPRASFRRHSRVPHSLVPREIRYHALRYVLEVEPLDFRSAV